MKMEPLQSKILEKGGLERKEGERIPWGWASSQSLRDGGHILCFLTVRGEYLLWLRALQKLQKQTGEEFKKGREGSERGSDQRQELSQCNVPAPEETAEGFQPAGPSVSSNSRAKLISVRRRPMAQSLPLGSQIPIWQLKELVCLLCHGD